MHPNFNGTLADYPSNPVRTIFQYDMYNTSKEGQGERDFLHERRE